MIIYKPGGNILESSAKWLIVPVNCLGVMEKGLALAFAKKFPLQEQIYKGYCRDGYMKIGTFQTANPLILFPTKSNWWYPSELTFIRAGLKTLAGAIQPVASSWGSLAVPALGCGLGGLDWPPVKALIIEYLGDLPIPVEVYLPQ